MNKKNIKICIFDKMCTPTEVLNSNGDNILDNICTKCETYESLDSSGTYELDAIFNIDDNGLYNLIVDEAILKVTMDYGEEIFRIASLEKEMKEIIVFARQITISETLDMWIEDIRPTDTNGIGALTTLRNKSIGKKDINVFSNITNISTAYYQRMNMHNAIHSCDQSFISRWGGEILRRKYNLSINTKVGNNRGVKIISGKNIIGFRATTNIDNVVTRIRAVGNDGITASNYIDSPLIDKYSAIKTKEIKYENVKIKDENNPDEGFDNLEQAQRELERLGELEFNENHIDELKAEYSINFIYLEKTEEYKNYVQAERVYLGDIVQVYEKNYDLEISVRVVSKRYDVLKQRVIEIELSNTNIKDKTITANDIISEIKNIISSSENNNVKDIMQSMINSGIKDSYVIPRQNEIIIADNKDINQANYICRINKNGMAFSKNGYYGDYEYGFTIDGVINASLISTGILRTILIENVDGSFQIDLSKPGGALFKNNGKDAIKIENNAINLYNWAKEGNYVGALTSLTRLNDKSKALIGLVNNKDAAISVGYESPGKTEFKSYMEFDKFGVLGNLNVITLLENVGLLNSVFNIGLDNQHSIYNAAGNNLCIAHKDKLLFVNKENGKAYLKIEEGAITFYDENGKAFFWKDKGDNSFYINGDLKINGEITGKVKNFNDEVIFDSDNPGGNNNSYLNGYCSENGFVLIKSMEGFASKPYNIGDGTRTIGYGVTEKYEPEYFNQLLPSCTEQQASEVFGKLLYKKYSKYVYDLLKKHGKDMNTVKQCEFDAFVSFYYNHGNLDKKQIFIDYVNGVDKNTIYNKWLTTVIMPGSAFEQGLRDRRKREATAFRDGVYNFKTISNLTTGEIIKDNNGKGHIPDEYKNKPEVGGGGTALGNAIIASARKLIGKPYVWGGNYPPLGSSNGTDCSGLCQWAYNDNGIKITRTTYTQITEGVEVSKDNLQPGDLIFTNFSSPGVPEHVFLYSGKNANGELMCVEAPSTGLNIRERVFNWKSSTRARRILSTKSLINENVELKNKILNLEERLSNLEKLYRGGK